MARPSRKLSCTGIYHVMARGVNRANIFHDVQDRNAYLGRLVKFNTNNRCSLLSYCLMDNHLHLLLKDNNNCLSEYMKSIGISYVHYFNRKYKRVGHLFQDRFESEIISTEYYLLNCVRYIHHNPVAAGMVKSPGFFRWSSYNSYLGKDVLPIACPELILNLFSQHNEQAIDEFIKFSSLKNDDKFIDVSTETDIDLKAVTKEVLNFHSLSPQLFPGANKELQSKIIKKIREQGSFSYREMAITLGISKDFVYRACKAKK